MWRSIVFLFYVKESDVIVHEKYFLSSYNPIKFLAIL